MAELRHSHPFHMHDAIRAQPAAFGDVVERHARAAETFAARLDPQGRVFIVGTGTSLHAAILGEHLFRLLGGGAFALAVPAFDFALYGPELHPQDTVIVLTHRGTKKFSVASLERAHAAGCRTALVCGEGAPAPPIRPDALFPTVPQERSSAHTVSYVGALAVLAALAAALGHVRTHGDTIERAVLTHQLPALMARALLLEADVAATAARHSQRRRIWLVGAGPDAVTATEIALKIKESSYIQAEGMAVEAMLHGPFQCAEPDDLFVLITTPGPGSDRLEALAHMAGRLTAACLWVGSGLPPVGEGCASLAAPEAPPPFSCLTSLVPLQLLAYHLALAKGRNPDGFRLDDQRFAAAAEHVRL